jgi:predicted nucleic acid-binding protein
MFESRLKGNRFGTCIPVLCEIEAGIRQLARPQRYRRNLNHLLRQVRIWPVDLKTARLYGDIYQELRRRGRALSQVDITLAALARQMGLILLTTDRDFEAVRGLRTEDWSE